MSSHRKIEKMSLVNGTSSSSSSSQPSHDAPYTPPSRSSRPLSDVSINPNSSSPLVDPIKGDGNPNSKIFEPLEPLDGVKEVNSLNHEGTQKNYSTDNSESGQFDDDEEDEGSGSEGDYEGRPSDGEGERGAKDGRLERSTGGAKRRPCSL